MSINLIILDFDGTLTDVDKEAVPCVLGWKEDVGKELGFTSEEINKKWLAAESKIKLNPHNYGWIKGGKIVAPACADPLVMATVTTQVLFDEEKKYLDIKERDIIQSYFFKNNYKKSITAFKEGADDLLVKLKNQFYVYIVTNSSTQGVFEKIKQLPSNHSDIKIYGDAQKYNISSDWNEVPESIEKKGFGRPLLLQRKQYWGVLQEIMKEKQILPKQVAVVGDIYELDLLLPEYMGMTTILAKRNNTVDYEINAVKSSSSGYVADNLENVIKYLDANR